MAIIEKELLKARPRRALGRSANVRYKTMLGVSVVGALVLAVCLLAVEAGVRCAYSEVTRTPERDTWFSLRWFQEKPIAINQKGYRERDFQVIPEPRTTRVIVLGDSLTFGEGVRTHERFTELVSQRLASASGQYEILNFGRSGASISDHLVALERDVLPAAPKVVLLQWYVDDVRQGPPPTLRKTQLVPWQSLHRFLHQNSASYYLLERWWRIRGRKGDLEIDSPYSRAIPTSEEALREHATRVRRFIEITRAHGALVQIVVFPSLVEVRGRPDRYPHAKSMDRVLEICAETQTRCLDLRLAFAAVEPASTLWANRLFMHPGARANAIAAEAIVDQLADEWPID